MTSFERPTSIELEVQPKDESQIPLKQREILNDLFDLTKIAGLPHKPIGGFQKNNDGTFTITLNATDQRTKFMTFLSRNQTIGAFIYHPSSADLVGGQLTLLGAPNEYPNHKLHAMMSPYVDIVKIKNGSYKEHPEVRNGVKHLTFKKILKPYPTQMKLPEGYMLKIKTEGSDDRPKGCYRCGGNHLIRDCSIDLRSKAQQENQQRQPTMTYATIVNNNQEAQTNTQTPKPLNTKRDRQNNQDQAKTDQNQNTKHITETTPENTTNTNDNTEKENPETSDARHMQTNQTENQYDQNRAQQPKNDQELNITTIQRTPDRKNQTQNMGNQSNDSNSSPPPTPSFRDETPEKKGQTKNPPQNQTRTNSTNPTKYNDNSWLNPRNTQKAITSFVERTDQSLLYPNTSNRFGPLDTIENPEDSYFEDPLKPVDTPLKGKIGQDSPVKPHRRSIYNEVLNSTPFHTYKINDTKPGKKKQTKRKEPESLEKTGKRTDNRQTPETTTQSMRMRPLSESSGSESDEPSTEEMLAKIKMNQKESQNHMKITNISGYKELSISDIKANQDQEVTF